VRMKRTSKQSGKKELCSGKRRSARGREKDVQKPKIFSIYPSVIIGTS
jgi:hypothetical protein